MISICPSYSLELDRNGALVLGWGGRLKQRTDKNQCLALVRL